MTTWLDHVPDQEVVGRLVDRLGEEFPDDQADYLQRAGGDARYSLWLRLADEHLGVLGAAENETIRFPWRAAYEHGWSPRDAAFAAFDSPTPELLRSIGPTAQSANLFATSDRAPYTATVQEVGL